MRHTARNRRGQMAIALNVVIGVFIMGVLAVVSYEMSRLLLAREQLKACTAAAALAGEATLMSSTQQLQSAKSSAEATALNIFRKNAILGKVLAQSTNVPSLTSLNPAPGQAQLAFTWVDSVTHLPGGTNDGVLSVSGAYTYEMFGSVFEGGAPVRYTVTVNTTAALPAIDMVFLYDISASMDDQTPVTCVKRYWDYNMPPAGVGQIHYLIPPVSGGPPEQGPLYSVVCPMPMGSAANALPPQNLDAAMNPNYSACAKYFSEIGNPCPTIPLRGVWNYASPPGNAPPPYPGLGPNGGASGPGFGGSTGPGVGGGGGGLVFTNPGGGAGNPAPGSGINQGGGAGSPVGGAGNPAGGSGGNPGYPPASNVPPGAPGAGTWGPSPGVAPGGGNTPQEYMAMKQFGVGRFAPVRFFDEPVWAQAAPVAAQPAGCGFLGPPDTFTDIIVNLDGNTSYANYTSPDGFNFPGLGAVVEASRGNLDSTTAAQMARLNLSALGVQPQNGYQLAYAIAAAKQLQPKRTVEDSIMAFMQKVSMTNDVHYGLVAFSDRAGTSPTDALQDYAISWVYPIAGGVSIPLPNISVSQTNNNYSTIQNWFTVPPNNSAFTQLTTVDGGTNIADALQKGIAQLTDGSSVRKGALKVIVLVTDGVPTRSLTGQTAYSPPSNTPAITDAIAQAVAARQSAIPVFVLALDQGGLQQYMSSVYNDSSGGNTIGSGGAASGLAGLTGRGAKYYYVGWNGTSQTKSTLDASFGSLARQLVSLVGL